MTTPPETPEVLSLLGLALWRGGAYRPSPPPRSLLPFKTAALVEDESEHLILTFLERYGASSPKTIGRALAIPKATLHRKLARLTAAGLLHAQGHTRNACYRISSGKN